MLSPVVARPPRVPRARNLRSCGSCVGARYRRFRAADGTSRPLPARRSPGLVPCPPRRLHPTVPSAPFELRNSGDRSWRIPMGKINLARVFLGGLLAGLIINIFEYVLNGVVFASQWDTFMKALEIGRATRLNSSHTVDLVCR